MVQCTVLDSIPTFDQDLFSPDVLRDPFEHYRALRDLGPVVYLSELDVYAISRFDDVREALRAPAILISGHGVGFNDILNAPVPEPRTIHSDGERHRRLRNVLAKPLMPAALREQRELLRALITQRIKKVVDTGEIDAISILARHLPVEAVSYLVGLPEEGRLEMLRWATASFNAAAPLAHGGAPDDDVRASLGVLQEAASYFQAVDPATLRPGSWAQMLFDAVSAGRLSSGEARAAISGLVLPSLDTTIFAKGNLLYNLGANPDQWQLLKERRDLITSAVLESVRHSAIVRWFSRYAVEDYRIGSFTIPTGARVMILYGSANRDERHYPEPDRFDVTRNPVDQLGWGTGPHMCAGMHLARLEMEVMLAALLEQVERIEVGSPQISSSRGLYGFDSLPMRLFSA